MASGFLRKGASAHPNDAPLPNSRTRLCAPEARVFSLVGQSLVPRSLPPQSKNAGARFGSPGCSRALGYRAWLALHPFDQH